MAERAALPALLSSNPIHDRSLYASQRMGIVGHKVLDVPKKHTAKQVLELANGFMKELNLQSVGRRRPKRCTEITGAQLKMVLPDIPKCKAFMECKDFLHSQCRGIFLGQLHFPMVSY